MNIKFNKRFKDIYLILTEFCPNRCEYCYISNRDKRETMLLEYVDKIIESFEYSNPRIIFFGGEPLVEIQLIGEILKKYYTKCRFQMITSGLVNFESFIENVYSQYPLNELQISWDGPLNNNRISLDNVNRQDEVFKKIIYTLNKDIQVDAKCVLNDNNIINLYNIYKIFQIFVNKYPNKFRGEFVIAHQQKLTSEFSVNLNNNLSLILNDIGQQLLFSSNVYIPREFLNKILLFLYKDNNVSSCDAGNYIVVLFFLN